MKMGKFVVRHGSTLAHCPDAEHAARLMLALESSGPAGAQKSKFEVADTLNALSGQLQRVIAEKLAVQCTTLRDGEFHLRSAARKAGQACEARSCLKLINDVNKASSVCRHFSTPWAERVLAKTIELLDRVGSVQQQAAGSDSIEEIQLSSASDLGESQVCEPASDPDTILGSQSQASTGFGPADSSGREHPKYPLETSKDSRNQEPLEVCSDTSTKDPRRCTRFVDAESQTYTSSTSEAAVQANLGVLDMRDGVSPSQAEEHEEESNAGSLRHVKIQEDIGRLQELSRGFAAKISQKKSQLKETEVKLQTQLDELGVKVQELRAIKDIDIRVASIEVQLHTESITLKAKSKLLAEIQQLNEARPKLPPGMSMQEHKQDINEKLSQHRAAEKKVREKMRELRSIRHANDSEISEMVKQRAAVDQEIQEKFQELGCQPMESSELSCSAAVVSR